MRPALYILILIGALLVSCSSYRGPNYKTPDQYNQYNSLSLGDSPGLSSQEFRLEWPVKHARLTQFFAPSYNPAHQGLDLAAKRNTAILAAHAGRVVFAGKRYRGYGKMVLLEFNSEWATLYAHFNSLDVKTGDWVEPGQRLGGMGATGRATGVHLHFELIRDKQPINPLPYLPKKDIKYVQK